MSTSNQTPTTRADIVSGVPPDILTAMRGGLRDMANIEYERLLKASREHQILLTSDEIDQMTVHHAQSIPLPSEFNMKKVYKPRIKEYVERLETVGKVAADLHPDTDGRNLIESADGLLGSQDLETVATELATIRSKSVERVSSYLFNKAAISCLAEIEEGFANLKSKTDAKVWKLIDRATAGCRSAEQVLSDLGRGMTYELISQLNQKIEALGNYDNPGVKDKVQSSIQDNLDYTLAAGEPLFFGHRLGDLRKPNLLSSASFKEVRATLESIRDEHEISVYKDRRNRKAAFRHRQAKKDNSVGENSVLQQSCLDDLTGWLNENRYEINLREDPPYAHALMQYVNDTVSDMQWEHSKWQDTQVTEHGRRLVYAPELQRLTLPSEKYDHMMSILKSSGEKDSKAKELWRSIKRTELDHIVLMKKAETISQVAPRSMAREIQAQRAQLLDSINRDASYTVNTVR
ncbi:hypothetical protein I204_00109 [Kwoniella mangroviensis CBS 8886]|nr:hypothetical protein I204_00109 [Kwoniella mangroviensis CBS 8886]